MITGIHHVALRCRTPEEYKKVVSFYKDVLQLPLCREWAGGTMLDTGAGLMEIFAAGGEEPRSGSIRHFAFDVPDPDVCAAAVTAAGYEVFMEPHDIVIPADPPFPARIAFCYGPMGEEIEFFHEK